MKIKGKFILIPAVLLGVVICFVLASNFSKDEALWIDVRSVAEYQADHISGHLNVPHTELAAKIGELAENKNAPIHLYCRSGRRAELNLRQLKQLGYTKVTNHGGIADVRRELNVSR